MTTQTEPTDEYFLDAPQVRDFIAHVRRVLADQRDIPAALTSLQPSFAALLADQTWLPDEFAAPYEQSGMGGGIGSWLLFRAADRSLTLFSLVVPAGATTPVHDHLAWGFIGLYRGTQREWVYARAEHGISGPLNTEHEHTHSPSADDGVEHVVLDLVATNDLIPGDFYTLLPPDGDIHAVETTSNKQSISIHLLANDTGCVVRHAFDPAKQQARPFRSGYSNVECAA